MLEYIKFAPQIFGFRKKEKPASGLGDISYYVAVRIFWNLDFVTDLILGLRYRLRVNFFSAIHAVGLLAESEVEVPYAAASGELTILWSPSSARGP